MSDKPIKRVFSDGTIEYILNGELLHREDEPAVEFPDGTKKWYLNGKLHREDGPAVEWPDGSKSWYLNGECHREDGPAVESSDGSKHWYKLWYLNGKCHREDGPAVESSDGTKHWYLNGKKLSEQAWIDTMWDSFTEEQKEELVFNGFELTEDIFC